MISKLSPALFPATILLASCGATASVDTEASQTEPTLKIEEIDTYHEPWAAAFVPGTEALIITQKTGEILGYDTATGREFTVSGAPEIDYGGQGGLGDIAFLNSEATNSLAPRTIYLSWAEAGAGDTRGAAVGKGTLLCQADADCEILDLEVIWRQSLKTGRRGHYSHRIRFSPDEEHLFVTSGDRQELDPAQDNSNNLGTIVRLNLDGTPAQGNPFADEGGATAEIWSYGHRNLLGFDFDAEGRLWEVEHGPAGGDEFNLVQKGANYGWPTRSNGDHYRGEDIPDHTEDDGFNKPAVWWTPVIAPGDMIFYRGDMFSAWKGDALIAGLGALGLVRVEVDGDSATEAARYDLDGRIRSVDEAPDGSLWVFEDGEGGRLLRLTAE